MTTPVHPTPTCLNSQPSLLLPAKQFTAPVAHQSLDHPSDLERASIRKALVDIQMEMSRIDGEIQQVTTMLADLRPQRETVQGCSASYEALLAPVQKLPMELLSEVFELCLPGSSNVDRYRTSTSDSPLLLAQVNRQWRYAALSTPRLWATIRVSIGLRGPAHAANLMQTWIKRSGQLPLSLDVQADADNTDCGLVLNAIIPHSERWESVSFSNVPLSDTSLAPIRGRLSSLKTLELHGKYTARLPFGIFELAPQLRTMHANCAPLSTWLPWNHLTSWSGNGMTLKDGLDILRYAHNLVSCNIDVSLSRGVALAPLQHDSLCYLRISMPYVEDWEALLSLPAFFTFPALCALSISGNCPRRVNSADFLLPFWTRSPHLRALALNINMVSGILAQILSQARPPLVNIKFGPSCVEDINDTFMEQLTHDPNNTDSCLIPHLKTIVFDGGFKFSPRAFVSMVQSRLLPQPVVSSQAGVACLESVRLHSYDKPEDIEGIDSGVRLLKGQGLDVSIKYHWSGGSK